jgi:hypothetical protein
MRARRMSAGLVAATLCLLGAALLPAARAGVDVDLGASVPLGDNGRLFFHISSNYFDFEPAVVEHWGVRYTNPDDLAVSLFIARQSGRSPDVVFALRRQGLSWWDVGLRVGVPTDAWFVPVERDPGPPYGNAYGHWKKHRENPKYMLVLRDADVRNLVAVRMAHEYYRVPMDEAMRWRSSSRNVRELMVHEYEGRHSGPHAENGRGDDRGQGSGKSKEKENHGKGRGRGRDW